MLPMKNNGAAVIYNNVIAPFIKKHEKSIERGIEFAGGLTKDLAKDGM